MLILAVRCSLSKKASWSGNRTSSPRTSNSVMKIMNLIAFGHHLDPSSYFNFLLVIFVLRDMVKLNPVESKDAT